MDDVILYEAGLRVGGKYSSFIQSRNEFEVDEYIEIMKETKTNGSEIVKYKKHYKSVSCIPQIIK